MSDNNCVGLNGIVVYEIVWYIFGCCFFFINLFIFCVWVLEGDYMIVYWLCIFVIKGNKFLMLYIDIVIC